jgi:hypothetical protein
VKHSGPSWSSGDYPGLLFEQWWLTMKPSVTYSSKGKPWNPIPGIHEEHNWNWRAILEQSCWRPSYLCPKLLTFEPKMVKKVHPGADRSILRSGGSSSEALPGALESTLGQKRLCLKPLNLILELCRLILEPWRLTLQPWQLYLDHCGLS